jgi:hypothetical protein
LGRRLLVLAALLGSLTFAVGGASAATYTDPQGDATGAAGDITQVDVTNDVTGNIRFNVTLANRSAVTADDIIFIFLDGDNNAATGLNGLDFVIVVDAAGTSFFRATGSSFAPSAANTLSSENGGRTVRINRSDLGGTTAFTFFASTGLDSDENAGDDAPDGDSVFLYTLQLRPALDSLLARFSPAKPKAGKAFRVASTSARLEDGTDVRPGSITCVAKLNGKRLRGRCAWRIPRNAGGKLLVVTITARYRGASATFLPWRFRVLR